ncbi:MAG: prepilin-type N-terminal cleavage/methylation domain-containing protein [Candidatus Zixiibacteriota bacterium]
MRKLFGKEEGFTLVELAIGLVIIGLLIGAILGGSQMIANAKIRRQVQDLRGLYGAAYTFFDKFTKLPGDRDGNGFFDSDSTVWNDIEGQNLAYKAKRSPFGSMYNFGSDTSTTPAAHRAGNFIMVSLPKDVAENIDKQLDDGVDTTGIVTTNTNYSGTGRCELYYFLD